MIFFERKLGCIIIVVFLVIVIEGVLELEFIIFVEVCVVRFFM